MPRLPNQPSFISRTKRTGLAEQWLSSVCGFMSSMLTTLPSSPTLVSDAGRALQPKFLAAKSQFASELMKVSAHFGRWLR